jgi:hypothetical protein
LEIKPAPADWQVRRAARCPLHCQAVLPAVLLVKIPVCYQLLPLLVVLSHNKPCSSSTPCLVAVPGAEAWVALKT